MKKRAEDWSENDVLDGLRAYKKTFGRYPTATEVDSCVTLPSARTLQRTFGGLVALKKKLGGTVDEIDFRTGSHSSNRARAINKRAHENEQEVYMYLCERFGKPFVHREYFFTDDHRTRADFFVYDSQQGFCVDVFYPENRQNLNGCLNIKLNKYSAAYAYMQYPVIFLQMNKKISQEEIATILENKKRKLNEQMKLLTYNEFIAFCKKREPFNA